MQRRGFVSVRVVYFQIAQKNNMKIAQNEYYINMCICSVIRRTFVWTTMPVSQIDINIQSLYKQHMNHATIPWSPKRAWYCFCLRHVGSQWCMMHSLFIKPSTKQYRQERSWYDNLFQWQNPLFHKMTTKLTIECYNQTKEYMYNLA